MTKPPNPPPGMASLTPHLVVAGAAQAIDFYERAFGAEEMIRLPTPDGRLMHASLSIDGASVMLVDEMPEWGALGPKTRGGTSVTLHLFVPDVDAAVVRAVAAGATVVMPVADMFWGDRYGQVQDPFGHRWSLATPKKQLTEAELRTAAAEAMRQAPQCGS
jgi:uncharacterized glyoxalase superfamily protein PhnB